MKWNVVFFISLLHFAPLQGTGHKMNNNTCQGKAWLIVTQLGRHWHLRIVTRQHGGWIITGRKRHSERRVTAAAIQFTILAQIFRGWKIEPASRHFTQATLILLLVSPPRHLFNHQCSRTFKRQAMAAWRLPARFGHKALYNKLAKKKAVLFLLYMCQTSMSVQ